MTNDQDPAKMPEMWITNAISGRRSTVMELASATPLNESQFSGRQTTVTTSSLNTMGTKRKHKSGDDDKMQADSLKKGDPGSWTSENGKEPQTARPTRAGVSDEVAQEFQVISSGNANMDGPQVNLQNEICDPDEYENREAISSGESNAARPMFITSCGSPRDTTRQKLYG